MIFQLIIGLYFVLIINFLSDCSPVYSLIIKFNGSGFHSPSYNFQFVNFFDLFARYEQLIIIIFLTVAFQGLLHFNFLIIQF